MLKKIKVEQLTVGMHLKEFCGSWMEHPFWRSAFVISDPKDLEAILASSIEEAWIDTSKGSDVAPGEAAVSEAETEEQVDAELGLSAEAVREVSPVSASEEFARAAKICTQGKRAVTSMFQEARMGKAVDTAGAQRLVEEISDSVSRNPSALIGLARLKTADDYTYMRSVAVCALMVALSKHPDHFSGVCEEPGNLPDRLAGQAQQRSIGHRYRPGRKIPADAAPRIKVFFSIRSNARIQPEIVDLSRPTCVEKIVNREDPAKWNFPDINELWSGQKTD